MAATTAFNWNNWLNDSKQLAKIQSYIGMRRRGQPVYTKQSSSMIKKRSAKVISYKRKSRKTKLFGSNRKNLNPVQATPKKDNQWKQEYDIWNMMTQTLDHYLQTNHQIIWDHQEIGVRDSNDQIRLIKNRQDLNQMIFINSNGKQMHAEKLINPNASNNNMALRIKFRLVPVMQGFSIVDDNGEQSYTFGGNTDLNNNNNDCDNMETDKELYENLISDSDSDSRVVSDTDFDTTLTSESEFDLNSNVNVNNDNTLKNVSFYSDFVFGLKGRPSSTLVSEKENVPVFPTSKQ